MGEYMTKCNRCRNYSEEVDHGGVRMRAKETTSSGTAKRMKIDSENFELLSSNTRLGNHGYPVNSPDKSLLPATSENSDQVIPPGDLCSSSNTEHVLASRCSSNECLRSVDLEAEGFETENSTCMNNKFSRETTPLSELCGDTDEMESPAKKSTARHRRIPQAGKMPATTEIEEFFSVAEKYEQKRFAEKYNYDIVKDMPLEGQYHWVRLKP